MKLATFVAADGSSPEFGVALDDDRVIATSGSDVYVRDRLLQTTERISMAPGSTASTFSREPAISGDGRFVVFSSGSTNLVPGHPHPVPIPDIYICDRLLQTNAIVSVPPGGDQSNDSCFAPSVSEDGRVVASSGGATNLVPDDNNAGPDVFVRAVDATEAASDRSGDGDLDDTVLESLNANSEAVLTMCPAGTVPVAAATVAFLRPEAAGTTPNLPGCPAGPVVGSAPDLNGNGDTDGTVVHVHAATGGARANTVAAADSVQVCGSAVVFITPENAQANDLNADGDQDDRVIQVFGPGTNTLIAVGRAAEQFVCGPGLVAFRTSEAAQNGLDPDDDGDSIDFVLQVCDVGRPACLTGAAPGDCLSISRDTIRPCLLDACDPRLPYRVLSDLVRFLTFECDQGGDVTSGCAGAGSDLSGDIRAFAGDLVLQVFQPSTGLTRVIGKVDGSATANGGTRGSGNPIGSGDGGESSSPSTSRRRTETRRHDVSQR